MAIEDAVKGAAPPLPGVEIATAGSNPFEPVFDNLLRSNDDTLASRGGNRGLKIYRELRRDPHCFSVLQKREMAVTGREWSVEPASSSRLDKKAAETVEATLKKLPFDRICTNLLDATLMGYAVAEIIWAPTIDAVPIQRIKARDQRRFVFDLEERPRLLTISNMAQGTELPERKFIVHRFGGKDENVYGLGLGSALFWPVFFKRKGISFWLTFIDKFASPTAIGTYPAGTDDTARRKLLAALQAISQEACVTIPQGMEVELLEAARSGNVNSYETLCRYMDEEISKAVLGEIHTTGGGASGMGGGRDKVANDVRLELAKADADLLSATLNTTLVQWITEFNHPGATPPRVFWDCSAPEDIKARADRDKVLNDMGLEPDDDYLADKYPGWRRKAAATGVPGAFVPPGVAELAEAISKRPLLAYKQRADAPSQIVDALESRSEAALAELMEPVRRLVATAPSLEAIRDGMEAMFAELPSEQLTAMLHEAMAAAHLIGRVEVQSEQSP